MCECVCAGGCVMSVAWWFPPIPMCPFGLAWYCADLVYLPIAKNASLLFFLSNEFANATLFYVLDEGRFSHNEPVSPSGLLCGTLGVRLDERLDCEKPLISAVFSPTGTAVSPPMIGPVGLNNSLYWGGREARFSDDAPPELALRVTGVSGISLRFSAASS